MKILTILGARPQFIKVGTVSREICNHTNIDYCAYWATFRSKYVRNIF